jgi:uncharacterized membrane protein
VGHALRDVAPELGAYALSFAVIAMFWLAHHRLLNAVARLDHTLLVSNLVQLGLIALIPFPTQVLGQHGDQRSAAILYASVLAIAGLAGTVSWLHVLRAGLAFHSVPRSYLQHGIWRGLTLAGVFVVSLPLIVISATVGEWSWAGIAIGHFTLGRRFGSIHRPAFGVVQPGAATQK